MEGHPNPQTPQDCNLWTETDCVCRGGRRGACTCRRTPRVHEAVPARARTAAARSCQTSPRGCAHQNLPALTPKSLLKANGGSSHSGWEEEGLAAGAGGDQASNQTRRGAGTSAHRSPGTKPSIQMPPSHLTSLRRQQQQSIQLVMQGPSECTGHMPTKSALT